MEVEQDGCPLRGGRRSRAGRRRYLPVGGAAPALRALQCRYRIVSGFRGSVGLLLYRVRDPGASRRASLKPHLCDGGGAGTHTAPPGRRRCAQGPVLGDSPTVTNGNRAPGQVLNKTQHFGADRQVDKS